MSKRIFIWVAHPRKGSLCEAMADAYQQGAEQKGEEIRRMDLCEMQFDANQSGDYADTPTELEADLRQWQENLQWAEHIMVIHPYWWGSMPAQAKAVLDRALLPGVGFKYHGKGLGWDKLLSGRKADVIITSDTPPLLDRLLYRRPGRRVLTNQVLGFCGVKTRKVWQFGSVKTAKPQTIERWLLKTQQLGASV
ncbi:NAD(P)H-dependent oxidoreductase [Aliagarivorans marinus]|uniref:NAD(P)H-dependent oxidoreductase n=1 Tax=Aliagarivorans marinus TaxID=561965 RepID=UPI0004184A3C|nr:NAD(P)H-dependent oxidoreductase [Aliagarivorans marinus]